MSEATHTQIEGLIHQYFAGELSAQAHSMLRNHVRDCEQCERVYERYAAADRGLHQCDGHALTAAALGRLEVGLFESERVPPPRSPWWSRAPLFAAALASMIALLMLRPSNTQDVLQARGGVVAPGKGVSLRVLRLRHEGDEVIVQDLGTKDTAVTLGDEIILLYTNLAGAQSVQVILRNDEHARVVLVPRHTLQSQVEDVRLGPPLKVDKYWPLGTMHIEAEFEDGEDRILRRVPVKRVQP